MKKLSIAFFLVVLGLFFSVSSIYAEMAKEGSGNYRSAKSSKNEVLAMGKDYMQVNMSQLGMVVDAPKNSPFENATPIVAFATHLPTQSRPSTIDWCNMQVRLSLCVVVPR